MPKITNSSQEVSAARINAIAIIIAAVITACGGSLISYRLGTNDANDALISEVKEVREENQVLINQNNELKKDIRELNLGISSLTKKVIEASEPNNSANVESVSSSDTERQQAVMAIPIVSRTGADSRFKELQSLLAASKFQEANEKTAKTMNWIAQQEDGWISTAEAGDFECVDLQTIDRLWRAASYGKFGFSVQQDIWESTGNTEKFGDQVGWRLKNQTGQNLWKKYKDLTFDLRAKPGHLPARNLDPEYGDNGSMGEGWLIWAFRDSQCLN